MLFPDVVPWFPVGGLWRRLVRSPVTLAILCLTVLTTVVHLAVPSLDLVGRLGVGTPVLDGEWWRLVTYLLPQKLGLPHLLLNGAGLALYGPFLEHRIGRLGMLATYVVAGAFGGAWLVGAGEDRPNAGASLALFGVITALVVADAIFARARIVPAASFRRTLLLLVALIALLWPIEVAAYFYEDKELTLGLSFWGIIRHSPGVVAGLPLGLGFALGRVRRSPAWPALAVTAVLGATVVFVAFRTCLWPLWP